MDSDLGQFLLISVTTKRSEATAFFPPIRRRETDMKKWKGKAKKHCMRETIKVFLNVKGSCILIFFPEYFPFS